MGGPWQVARGSIEGTARRRHGQAAPRMRRKQAVALYTGGGRVTLIVQGATGEDEDDS